MKKVCYLLGCMLVFFMITMSVSEAAVLQVDPPKVFLTIPTGRSGSGKLTVRNPSEEKIKVKLYAQDWKYNELHDGTKVFFPQGTLPLSCASWISFSLSELEIPAEGSQDIYYTVKAPQDAVGGHFAVLFFESTMAKSIPAGNVSLGLVVRLGVIFYVETANNSVRTAEIENFSLKKQSNSKPLEISMDVKNTGNTDIIAKGTLHLINKKGVVFVRSALNKSYTLPTETAKLTGSWKEPLPKGTYDAILTIDIGKASQEEEWKADFVITKETEVEIGSSGEVLKAGELR
ncbi:MAG: hypothetical protein PHU23_10355 [Dehalococcoidales bacterium]|nr:hypothetical protein [Dehalococcoidales bacterium]